MDRRHATMPGAVRFDIVATIPEGGERREREMLQTMLEECFHLVVHRETREAAMFALVVARTDGRLGSKLRQSPVDCDALRAAAAPDRRAWQGPPHVAGVRARRAWHGPTVAASAPGDPPFCGSRTDDAIVGWGQRLATLARMLIPFAGREVVDRTGLTGAYDFDLPLPPENSGRQPGGPGLPGVDAAAGGIFTALQDELGLKLEPTRGRLEVVVIDSIEQPAAN